MNRLQPLDIIAEKTPFALTDLFIPGHFGHIAVWLGTEEQLKEIGMWEHPVIKPHQERIRNGYYILESIRPGSNLTTLDRFLEIDEITIMRQDNVLANYDHYSKIYERGMAQMYKKYDFNFDVHTLDKVVCSEVVYHAFGDVTWPTSYIFGRNTISPDEVISLSFYEESPVNFSFAVIGTKLGIVKKISKDTMAANLGFRKNFSRSSKLGRDSYDKKTKTCRKYRKRIYTGNSKRKKYRYYKKCKSTYEPVVYSHTR